MTDLELNTDAVDADELTSYEARGTCNQYSINFFEANEDVVLKVSEVNGTIHCWAYDRARDVTVDVSAAGQFDGAVDGAWNGDHNPNVDENCRWEDEFETVEAFKDEFYGEYSPFYA